MTPYASARAKILAFSPEEKQAILSQELSFSERTPEAFAVFGTFSPEERPGTGFGLQSPPLQSAMDKIAAFSSDEKRALVQARPQA